MMARWITVTKAPFDYVWPGRSAITAFAEKDLGEHFVKDEIADFAVKGGFAKEGKAAGSTARSVKTGPKAKRVTRARQPANRRPVEEPTRAAPKVGKTRTARTTSRAVPLTETIDAVASNLQPIDRLDGARLADDGGAANGRAVDPDARKR
jgi:hypothetical protein